MCILAPESTTNSPSYGSFCFHNREDPFFRQRVECSLFVRLELVFVFGKVPCLASGTSLLSLSLFMGPVLKFHCLGTSLMKIFDIYFSKRQPFLFPDTQVTQRGLNESNYLNCVQDLLHRVSLGLCSSLRNQSMLPRHNPYEIQFSQEPLHFCRRVLLFW